MFPLRSVRTSRRAGTRLFVMRWICRCATWSSKTCIAVVIIESNRNCRCWNARPHVGRQLFLRENVVTPEKSYQRAALQRENRNMIYMTSIESGFQETFLAMLPRKFWRRWFIKKAFKTTMARLIICEWFKGRRDQFPRHWHIYVTKFLNYCLSCLLTPDLY